MVPSRQERRAQQEASRLQKALNSMADRYCEIIIVRHAESDWNVFPVRLQGDVAPGPPLTALGRKQATALAIHLSKMEPCDAIYSSDLLRTIETATQIHHYYHQKQHQEQEQQAHHPPPPPLHLLPQLRERSLGVLTGLTCEEAQTQHPDAYAALAIHGPTSCPLPGGIESMHDMTQRAIQALERIALQHPKGRVVVVTHGGFMSAVHRRAAGRGVARMPNCGIGRVRIGSSSSSIDKKKKEEEGETSMVWTVVSWGTVDHLHNADVEYEAAAFGGGTSG